LATILFVKRLLVDYLRLILLLALQFYALAVNRTSKSIIRTLSWPWTNLKLWDQHGVDPEQAWSDEINTELTLNKLVSMRWLMQRLIPIS